MSFNLVFCCVKKKKEIHKLFWTVPVVIACMFFFFFERGWLLTLSFSPPKLVFFCLIRAGKKAMHERGRGVTSNFLTTSLLSPAPPTYTYEKSHLLIKNFFFFLIHYFHLEFFFVKNNLGRQMSSFLRNPKSLLCSTSVIDCGWRR